MFSGSIVTDTRTILAQNRIEMLKKQATSLALHQSKLDDELMKLGEVFQAKKRAMEVASEEFAVKLKKVCDEKPQIDEAKYISMVDDWTEKLMKAYDEYKTKQEALRAKQIVEREQLAEETPILYRLTVGDSSPSPKNKVSDEIQSPQVTTTDQQQQQQQQQQHSQHPSVTTTASSGTTTTAPTAAQLVQAPCIGVPENEKEQPQQQLQPQEAVTCSQTPEIQANSVPVTQSDQ
ncbi:unnamed protein product [Gongylonema pulchrum]|uniref:Uncharacterized protein n=1 Tax=Gongylonema pulchrum TaxID=637853 RepID=A0A3P7Q0S0_9BILA|nr:unnamed protein product [Gongylonema pulchrum]